jgi:magnesium transporter
VRHFHGGIEVCAHYTFGTLKRTGGDEHGEDCIALYIKEGLFVVVDIRDSDGSTRAGFESALRRFSPAPSPEKLIFAFLDTMVEGDAKRLEEMEYALSALEEQVLRDETGEDFTMSLLQHKKRLLLLNNYYGQLVELGSALQENENGIFREAELRYFKIFTDRAERLGRNVRELREQLSQLRDAHQSVLDMRLNRTMKRFTVLSAIFLPLNFITGWYGMNFRGMPELLWRHGYLFVAALSLAVGVCFVYFLRRRHWM